MPWANKPPMARVLNNTSTPTGPTDRLLDHLSKKANKPAHFPKSVAGGRPERNYSHPPPMKRLSIICFHDRWLPKTMTCTEWRFRCTPLTPGDLHNVCVLGQNGFSGFWVVLAYGGYSGAVWVQGLGDPGPTRPSVLQKYPPIGEMSATRKILIL